MDKRLTYEGWAAAGRKIRAGSTAEFYLVSPDGSACRPMFTRDQTQEFDVMDGVWTKVVPAADRPRNGRSKRDPRPKLKLAFDGNTLAVWCGPDKRAIDSMRKNGFRFERTSHRWQREASEEYFKRAVENYETAGYNVEVS